MSPSSTENQHTQPESPPRVPIIFMKTNCSVPSNTTSTTSTSSLNIAGVKSHNCSDRNNNNGSTSPVEWSTSDVSWDFSSSSSSSSTRAARTASDNTTQDDVVVQTPAHHYIRRHSHHNLAPAATSANITHSVRAFTPPRSSTTSPPSPNPHLCFYNVDVEGGRRSIPPISYSYSSPASSPFAPNASLSTHPVSLASSHSFPTTSTPSISLSSTNNTTTSSSSSTTKSINRDKQRLLANRQHYFDTHIQPLLNNSKCTDGVSKVINSSTSTFSFHNKGKRGSIDSSASSHSSTTSNNTCTNSSELSISSPGTPNSVEYTIERGSDGVHRMKPVISAHNTNNSMGLRTNNNQILFQRPASPVSIHHAAPAVQSVPEFAAKLLVDLENLNNNQLGNISSSSSTTTTNNTSDVCVACKICNKSFTKLASLKAHLRFHMTSR